MFCGYTTAGQDVFLEYRPDSKTLLSGSARYLQRQVFAICFECVYEAFMMCFECVYEAFTMCFECVYDVFIALFSLTYLCMTQARQRCIHRRAARVPLPNPSYLFTAFIRDKSPPLHVVQPCLTAWPTPHGRTVNCAPVHRYQGGVMMAFRALAGFQPLKSRPCICVHSHADAPESSGAFFRVLDGERFLKQSSRHKNALRASQAVRATDVMVNIVTLCVQKDIGVLD